MYENIFCQWAVFLVWTTTVRADPYWSYIESFFCKEIELVAWESCRHPPLCICVCVISLHLQHFAFNILVSKKWYLILVLISISLKTNYVGYFHVHLAVCIPSSFYSSLFAYLNTFGFSSFYCWYKFFAGRCVE